MSRLLALVVVLSWVSTPAWALSPAGTRGLRNAQIAIESVRLLPELRVGPIPAGRMQTARNLLRDLDSALARGRGELDRLSESDRADPAVARAWATLDEYRSFRDDLQKALTESSR